MRAAAAAALAALLLGGSAPAGAAGDALRATVLAHGTAAGGAVLLGDCARLEGPGAERLARAVIAAPPPPGGSLEITASQVRAALAGLGHGAARVDGAPACRVTTPSETIAPDRIREAAADAARAALPPLPGPEWRYRIEPVTAPPAVAVPAGGVGIEAASPPRAGPGLLTVLVAVTRAGHVVRSVPVTLRIALEGPALVAARDLPYHTVLGPWAVRRETREIASPGAEPLRELGPGPAWTTQFVPAGAVLTPRMVAPVPAVRRGELVTVVVRRGALAVSAAGRAREDGAVGQSVTVEIDGTGAVVRGVVTGPDTVEIGPPEESGGW